jgi:hypothetical protein
MATDDMEGQWEGRRRVGYGALGRRAVSGSTAGRRTSSRQGGGGAVKRQWCVLQEPVYEKVTGKEMNGRDK